MKKQTKYVAVTLVAIILIALIKNDFQPWKLFGFEKKETVYMQDKLCMYSTKYFAGFVVGKDTTCVPIK